jgi:hypothetical protein
MNDPGELLPKSFALWLWVYIMFLLVDKEASTNSLYYECAFRVSYSLWLIVRDVEEISKIRGQWHVPKTLFLLKTVNICQGPPTMTQKQSDALSVVSCPGASITTAAIWRDAPGVGRDSFLAVVRKGGALAIIHNKKEVKRFSTYWVKYDSFVWWSQLLRQCRYNLSHVSEIERFSYASKKGGSRWHQRSWCTSSSNPHFGSEYTNIDSNR